MTILDYYILDGHTPVAVEYWEWMEWELQWPREHGEVFDARQRVGRTEVPIPPRLVHRYPDGIGVSKVFLGRAHRADRDRLGRPFLFETLVFGGPLDMEMERYASWEEAERGHVAMVDRVMGALLTEAGR